MPCLVVSTEQLEKEFVRIFRDGEGVPDRCWVDHFHDFHTFIRAVYRGHLTAKGADRLMSLRSTLQDLYGAKSDVSIVIFLEDHDWEYWAAHRLWIHLR